MEDAFTKENYRSGQNPGDHGKKFEQDLAYVMFVRCSLEGCKFKLATEMVEGGKFDDVVLSFEDWKEVWLIQAKHADTTRDVQSKDLFPDDIRNEGSDFDLYKYIGSYFYVEQKLKSHPKKYFIFTNKSLEEDDLLKEWVDIATRNVNSLMDFSKIGGIYKCFTPKEDKTNTIKDRVNQKFIDLKDAIIKLFQEGKVEQILIDYKSPLQAILEVLDNCIKFREEFSEHCGDISQRELYKALHTHFQDIKSKQTPKIEPKKAINDLMKGRSRNQQLPPFVNETTVWEFFDRLTFCFNQPSDLMTIVDDDLRLYLCRWTLHRLRPNDLGKSDASQSILHRRKFDDTFQKWIEAKDGNESEKKEMESRKSKVKKDTKSFLSYDSGETCIQFIKDELKQFESNHSNALNCYYVNRSIEVHESESKDQKTSRIGDEKLLEQLENSFINNKCSSSILIAEPGMGKTTLLQYVGFEMQKRFKRDVFLIYLKSLNKNLQAVNSKDLKTMIYKVLENVLTETSLQVLQSNFESNENRVLLLFDGFDEIGESSKTNAITLFNKLLDTAQIQLIISGRQHTQQLLVEKLKLKVISLVPLEDDEQMQFLRLFWNIPTNESEKSKNEKFVKFSTLLLKKFHSDIGRSNYDFTGLPLMIRMLAEIHYCSFQEFLKSERTDPNVTFSSERFSVLKLFEEFIEKSFCMTVKKQLSNQKDYDIIETYPKDHIIHPLLEPFVIKHQWMAIKTLAVKELDNIITKEHSDTIARLSDNVKNGSEKSLLITFTSEVSSVEFNHLSYAEYFVAKYLYDNVDDCSKDLFQILNRHQVVQRFFFLMIEAYFGKSVNQMKIVDNICYMNTIVVFWACEASCLKVVKKLLEKRDRQTRQNKYGQSLLHIVGCSELTQYLLVEHGFKVDSKDRTMNTPVHYASFNGHVEVATMLINHSADVNARGQYDETPLHFAAKAGHLETAKMLIDRSANVNAQGRYGETPLHLAAKTGHLETAKMLIDRSGNVNAQNIFNSTPLHLTVENGHFEIVKMLIDRSADVNAHGRYDNTPLHLAASAGYLNIAKMLIDRSANVNAQGQYGETPLHLAAKAGHLETAKMLIDRSGNIDAQNEFNSTPLHLAVENGHLETAKMLIDRSANVNAQSQYAETPLHLAARAGHLETAKMLIDRLGNLDTRNKFNFTALHLTVENGHLEMVKMLIDRSANVNAHGRYDETPLHLAAKAGYLEIAKMLIDRSGNVEAENVFQSRPLHLTVENGHLEIAKMLLDRSANVDANGRDGETPLHLAAKSGYLEIVKMLIDRSANVNAHNQYAETPLHLAAKAGHLETAKMLIDRSGNVDTRNKFNFTPLHLTVENGHLEMVKMLIDRSANVNAHGRYDETPLHLAAKAGYLEIAKMLIDQSGNVEAENVFQSRPLHLTVENGHLEIAKMLLDRSAIGDANGRDGETPLHLAAKAGYLEIAKMLIDRSGNVEAENVSQSRPLHLTVENGHLELAKMLLDRSANGDANGRDGETPLHLAAKAGHLEIAKMLIDRSANVNAQNQNAETPLHLAAKAGHLEIAKMLLDRSANVNAQSLYDETPLHLAAKAGHLETAKMLIDRSDQEGA